MHGSQTLFSTSFFDFRASQSGGFVSPWIWLYVVVTACFTILCLSGWYLSSRSVSRRAERTMRLPDGVGDEHAADGTSPKPHDVHLDKLHDQSHQRSSVSGIEYTAANDSPQAPIHPSDGLAPAREFWDHGSIWGTQSYGTGGRACAMCAEHIE